MTKHVEDMGKVFLVPNGSNIYHLISYLMVKETVTVCTNFTVHSLPIGSLW